MEQDLLRYLLAAFPRSLPPSQPESDDEYLVIQGYRVPFESPVDDVMLEILADFRRRGFNKDSHSGSGRG